MSKLGTLDRKLEQVFLEGDPRVGGTIRMYKELANLALQAPRGMG